MGNALISRRGGGGYATVKFENYNDDVLIERVLESSFSSYLSNPKEELAATTIGNYALFAGGEYYSSSYTYPTTVDTYNDSLIKSTATSLGTGRSQLAATTVGNYALFGGGFQYSSNRYSIVDTYTSSLTKSTATSLSEARNDLAATTVGNYALFGGGEISSSPYATARVDAYNSSLTRSTPTALSQARESLAATTVGNYAIFAGGYISGTSSYSTVDAYNSSLTRSTPITSLGVGGQGIAATANGNYALFANYSSVGAYDNNLVKINVPNLRQSRDSLAATTVGSYALFGGGEYGSTDYNTVDAYETLAEITVYKGAKYKFQNMDKEATVTSNMEVLSIPTPATGYIKFKNTTIS